MDKIIFKGTVNGQEYNNVRDYNEAVKEALKHGPVQASSKTYTDNSNETESKTESETVQQFTKAPTPGIDIEYDEFGNVAKVNQLYLDEFCKRLEEYPNIDINLYCKGLVEELNDAVKNECVPYIKRAQKDTDFPNQLEGYLDDVAHIKNTLSTTQQKISDKITNLTNRLAILKSKKQVVDNMFDFYDSTYDVIHERLPRPDCDVQPHEQKGCNYDELPDKKETSNNSGSAQQSMDEYHDLQSNLIALGTAFANAIIKSIQDFKK